MLLSAVSVLVIAQSSLEVPVGLMNNPVHKYRQSTDYLLFIIIGIQPLGRFGQRPELSQSTGMALVRCILGKFLGIVCHCFPLRLDVPTFATRCLNDREILAAEGGTVGVNVKYRLRRLKCE